LQLSVVIPAYNEEAVIGNVLDQLTSMDVISEVIVVDDGSSDRTAEVARACQDVRVISHPYNMGNGAAVKTGIRQATGDHILLMDGDGQHPPSVIPELLAHTDQYEMVVGARTGASESHPARNLANGIFNAYASYITGHRVRDLTSGFRIVRTDVARSFLYLLPNGFSYPSTLTITLFRAGYAVNYVPFAAPARVGKSKIRPVKDGLRFLMTLTRLATLFVPLKIFVPISLVCLIGGGLYTISQLIAANRFSGFGGLVFTVGVLIFLLGLISEQIALLRYINSDR
jgi:glycosyltransferase involved in cell wall biosynthesis